jgi:hypothetical protein
MAFYINTLPPHAEEPRSGVSKHGSLVTTIGNWYKSVTHGPSLAAKAAYFVRETRSSNAPQDEERRFISTSYNLMLRSREAASRSMGAGYKIRNLAQLGDRCRKRRKIPKSHIL